MKKLRSTLWNISFLLFLLSCQEEKNLKVVHHSSAPKVQSHSEELISEGTSTRENFIEAAKKVMLENHVKLVELVGSEKIDLMNYLLNPYHIKTSSEPLLDSNGKSVDILSYKELVILYVGSSEQVQGWEKIFLDQTLTTRIILHELLTAANVDDEEYKMTNKVLAISQPLSSETKVLVPASLHPWERKEMIKNLIKFNDAPTTVCGSLSKEEIKITVKIRCNQEKDMTCKVYGESKKPLIKMKSSEMKSVDDQSSFSHLKDFASPATLKCIKYAETFDDCVTDSSDVSLNECTIEKLDDGALKKEVPELTQSLSEKA